MVCISNNSQQGLSVDVSINNTENKMGPKKPNLNQSTSKEDREVKEEQEEMIILVSLTFSIKASNKVNSMAMKQEENNLENYRQS